MKVTGGAVPTPDDSRHGSPQGGDDEAPGPPSPVQVEFEDHCLSLFVIVHPPVRVYPAAASPAQKRGQSSTA